MDIFEKQTEKALNFREKAENLPLPELVVDIDKILMELQKHHNFNHAEMRKIDFNLAMDFDKWFEERVKFYQDKLI